VPQTKSSEEKRHVITVRLDNKLGERLREISYHTRLKKQPILRDAIYKLILDYEKANKHKQKEIVAYLSTVSLKKLAPPCTAEKVILDKEISGLLRWFAFESRQTYQSIALVALSEYIKFLYPGKGETFYIDLSHEPLENSHQ